MLDPPAIEFCCVGISATARLPSICELLLLAATVATFIARLYLRSESGGIGIFFNSRSTANSPAVLRSSLPLLTFLSTSFACVSFNTSLLRSGRSAPSGVVLRQSSILARQGSECACALCPDLIALQLGHPAVSALVMFSLCNRAPSNGTGVGGKGSICLASLSRV